jgi:hypothetical protein
MQTRKTYKYSKTIKESSKDIASKRLPQSNSRNIKSAKTSVKNITEVKEHNIENLNEEEINKIIKQSRGAKKNFARTDIEGYKPLTSKQKIQVLEDLNKDSDKRILVYSELFGEIKTQINSLSTNISNKSNASKLQTTMQLKLSMDDIKEVDDEDEKEMYNAIKDLSSPGNKKYSNKALKKEKPTPKSSLRYKILNTTQSRGLFDWRDSEENIGLIRVPQMDYKSNSIKAVDSVSGQMFYKTSEEIIVNNVRTSNKLKTCTKLPNLNNADFIRAKKAIRVNLF